MEFKQLLYTIAIYIVLWILRSFADWWVKKSKTTANTLDDFLALNLRKMINAIPFKKNSGK